MDTPMIEKPSANRLYANECFTRMQAGDMAAFDDLHGHFEPMLKKSLGKRYPDMKHDVIEELVQETFVRAFIHCQTVDASDNCYGWLVKVANNLAMDYFRALGRRKESPMSDNMPDVSRNDDLPRDYESLARDAHNLVQIGLPNIKDTHLFSKALLLISLGCTYEVAASITGINTKTLLTRVHRLRKGLAEAGFAYNNVLSGDTPLA